MDRCKQSGKRDRLVDSITTAEHASSTAQISVSARGKCCFISATSITQHPVWVHPFSYHVDSIEPPLGATSRLAGHQKLRLELEEVLQLPTSDISPDLVHSFNESINYLVNALLLALCDDLSNIREIALANLQGVFRLTTRLPNPRGAVNLFADAFTYHGLALKCSPEIRLVVCRNICRFFPAEAFMALSEPEVFTAAFDRILSAVLQQQTNSNLTTPASSKAFCQLLQNLDTRVLNLVLESWATDRPELYTLAKCWVGDLEQSNENPSSPIHVRSLLLASISSSSSFSSSSSSTYCLEEEQSDAYSESVSWYSEDLDNILRFQQPLTYEDLSFLITEDVFQSIAPSFAHLSNDHML